MALGWRDRRMPKFFGVLHRSVTIFGHILTNGDISGRCDVPDDAKPCAEPAWGH